MKTGNFWDSIKIEFRRKSSGIRLKSNLEVSWNSRRMGEQKKSKAKYEKVSKKVKAKERERDFENR